MRPDSLEGDTSRTQGESVNLPAPRLEIIPGTAARPAAGGSIDALVTVSVDFPPLDVDRKPLNLALVIDRSGSMGGQPLDAAKQAAQTAVGMLMPGDHVSVVTFDSVIDVLVPSTKVEDDRSEILTKIAHVDARGSTDLYGGWAEGLSQVMACPEKDVVSRIVLLSDGGANTGVRDPIAIAADVARAVDYQVTTTAMGLGLHYNEALMRSIADAGHGNYEFLEGHDTVVEAFEQELAGLGALRGRDLTLAATGTGVRLHRNALNTATVQNRADTEGAVGLPDLVAGLPLELVVTIRFDEGASDPALVLTWNDVITGSQDEVRVDLDLPAVDAATFATLTVDPRVAERITTLRIAHAKLAASHAARAGNTAAARTQLDIIATMIAEMPIGEPRDQEERELVELRRRVEMEGPRMARYSEKLARAQFTNRHEERLKKMAMAEGVYRHTKTAYPATKPLSSAVVGSGKGADPSGAKLVHTELIQRPGRKPLVLELVLGDITEQRVDAIVNSSNRGLFGTSGVDGAIHRKAGPALRAATEAIGSIGYGEAVVTRGFDLPAHYVIHTAAPAWGATGRELKLLARCYDSAFAVADRLGARSVAVPAIGTGAYGYPIAEATRVAATAVSPWLTRGSFEVVRFVLLDEEVLKAYLTELASWRAAG